MIVAYASGKLRASHNRPRNSNSHSSICHWYSRFSVLLFLPLAWNHSFSKPLPLSTPSHLQPGLIPYRFGGAAPWYTLLTLAPPSPLPSPSAALLPLVVPLPSS